MISACTVRTGILLVLTLWTAVTFGQSPSNPAFWELPRRYNTSSAIDNGNANERVAVSQDFQTIYAGSDLNHPTRRLFFYYSTSCNSTNMTFDRLQELNNHDLLFPSIRDYPVMALIDRGNCSWSEKLRIATHLSSANGVNLTAAIIADNQTQPGAEYHLYSPDSVNQRSEFETPLPPNRNISQMQDNDFLRGSVATIPVYFAPKAYGDDMRRSITQVNSNSSNTEGGSVRIFWNIAAYLAPLTLPGGSSGSGAIFSRGYLSYIIALAAVFLVALFAGVIFLRWWRVRQLRDQVEYEAQLNAHAYNMQLRMQAKPLPVDLVNALPIVRYTPGEIKNAGCAICLEDFEEGETDVRVLGCGHAFCVLCIDPWLTQKSTLCPICKYDCMSKNQGHDSHLTAAPGGESSSHAGGPSTVQNSSTNNADEHASSVELQQIVTHAAPPHDPPSPPSNNTNNTTTTTTTTATTSTPDNTALNHESEPLNAERHLANGDRQ